MSPMLDGVVQLIARYLQQPIPGYEPFTPSDPEALRQSLQPGDVLLVEGNNKVSGVIKYLTQSTWSHAALFVGSLPGCVAEDGEPHVLIEANLGEGVVSAPLSKYTQFHTRICRPVGLIADDCAQVCTYAISRIGYDYDLKNIIDLMRYLFPMPVPRRWRRRLMALGSGDPTRLICSALIADAFTSVRYPILPKTKLASGLAREEILEIRHSSLVLPARLRHLALFQRGEAHHRARLRLQAPAMGRSGQGRQIRTASGALHSAGAGSGGGRSRSDGGVRRLLRLRLRHFFGSSAAL